MINESNFKQEIFEFADKKYGDRFEEFYDKFIDEFPYENYELDDEELYFKNFLDWLIIEKPLSETGRTMVEEFVKENPQIPESLKQSILKMKNFVRGEFKIISISGPEVILKKTDTGENYNIKLYDTMDVDLFKVGREIKGRIHEFDNMYRFCGAFIVKRTDLGAFKIQDPKELMDWFEENNIKKIQNKILNKDKKITAMLKNYPSQWIDAICRLYEIKSNKKEEKIKLISDKINQEIEKIINWLNEDSKYVLKLILKEGGYIKYSRLNKFDDEMDFWWLDKGIPKSTIGSLLVRGLIFIGKMPYPDGKLYKSALIPIELKDKINNVLL
jgi:hypothetical protein